MFVCHIVINRLQEILNLQRVLIIRPVHKQEFRFAVLQLLEDFDLFISVFVIIDEEILDRGILRAGRSIIHIHDLALELMSRRRCIGKLSVLNRLLFIVIKRILIVLNRRQRKRTDYVVRQQRRVPVVCIVPRNLIPHNVLIAAGRGFLVPL